VSAVGYLSQIEELDADARRDAAFFMLGWLQNAEPALVEDAAKAALEYHRNRQAVARG
jgi:hypothetical protein